jgi:hypothetical protein
MNPIIFLDHDGVICLSTEWGSRFNKHKKWGRLKFSMSLRSVPIEYRFDNFNEKSVIVLNEIIEKTNADIVISSDWKMQATIEEMGEYYTLQGIIKKPISFTPNINDCNNHDNTFKWIRDLDLEQSRCLEIKQYLQDNPSVNRWVSIDDMDLSVRNISPEWGLSNFVKTNPDGIGLCEDGIKDKVLSFLTKKDTYSYKENEICSIHLNLLNNEGLCLNCLNENHR